MLTIGLLLELTRVGWCDGLADSPAGLLFVLGTLVAPVVVSLAASLTASWRFRMPPGSSVFALFLSLFVGGMLGFDRSGVLPGFRGARGR